MAERILIAPGKRTGRSLANEGAFRQAIEDGKEVFMGPWPPASSANGQPGNVYFSVSLVEDQVVFTALERRPEL